jgi:hypothetical protein
MGAQFAEARAVAASLCEACASPTGRRQQAFETTIGDRYLSDRIALKSYTQRQHGYAMISILAL